MGNVECKWCGKEFEPKQQYCSTNCRMASHRNDKNVTVTATPKNVTESFSKPVSKSDDNVTKAEPIQLTEDERRKRLAAQGIYLCDAGHPTRNQSRRCLVKFCRYRQL